MDFSTIIEGFLINARTSIRLTVCTAEKMYLIGIIAIRYQMQTMGEKEVACNCVDLVKYIFF